MRFTSLIRKAIEFATERRGAIELPAAQSPVAEPCKEPLNTDGAEMPYRNHPLRVFTTLREVGQIEDPEVLSAGLLHDIIEETATTPQELEQKFGKNVARLVLELSDDKALSPVEQRQRRLECMEHLSREAALICLADKLNNVQDVVDYPPATWSSQQRLNYIEWTKSLFRSRPSFYRESPELSRLFEQTVERALRDVFSANVSPVHPYSDVFRSSSTFYCGRPSPYFRMLVNTRAGEIKLP
jgi:guanosine-3',5'-bis(diphosphate) 3'-pyrophosphohydrolase